MDDTRIVLPLSVPVTSTFSPAKSRALFLSPFIELIHTLVIAIPEHKFAALLHARKRAALIVARAGHVF